MNYNSRQGLIMVQPHCYDSSDEGNIPSWWSIREEVLFEVSLEKYRG